jgi:hypothetical protein
MTFAGEKTTVQFGSSSQFERPSDTSVKMCHALDANSTEGVYRVTDIVLRSGKGKERRHQYSQDFKDLVSFTFENDAHELPSIKDVTRVPRQ